MAWEKAAAGWAVGGGAQERAMAMAGGWAEGRRQQRAATESPMWGMALVVVGAVSCSLMKGATGIG